jgi:hypothetical protein
MCDNDGLEYARRDQQLASMRQKDKISHAVYNHVLQSATEKRIPKFLVECRNEGMSRILLPHKRQRRSSCRLIQLHLRKKTKNCLKTAFYLFLYVALLNLLRLVFHSYACCAVPFKSIVRPKIGAQNEQSRIDSHRRGTAPEAPLKKVLPPLHWNTFKHPRSREKNGSRKRA